MPSKSRTKRVAVQKAAAKKAIATVLVLRCCGPMGESRGGEFIWPLTPGAEVAASDWEPTQECGNGLHGWLWGEGDLSVACRDTNSPDTIWLVVEVAADSVIDLSGKVKFPRGVIRFSGKREDAANFVIANGGQGKKVHYGTATAGDRGTATAGNYGTATAGYYGTATAGDRGTATAGNYGTATAGDYGTATAGYGGTATAGYYGTATAGDRGTATAGYGGTATAGYGGTATAGYGGTLNFQYYDKAKQKYLTKSFEVSEDGIEPDVAYTLDTTTLKPVRK